MTRPSETSLRTPYDVALKILSSQIRPLREPESVPLAELAGRILATAVMAPVNVPAFRKSAMDGFALRSTDTPGHLTICGQSLPARPFLGICPPGQAVRITTGAPVPDDLDTVVPVEQVLQDGQRLNVSSPWNVGKHVILIGEDVAEGGELLSAGRLLRPQDLGILAAVGLDRAEVVRRPQVAILVTGEELLPPGSKPDGFRIVDSNSPMLSALATRDGAIVQPVRRLTDHAETIRATLATTTADVVLITGGSSVGSEDHCAQALSGCGELLVHGIAIRPAAPTGIGLLPAGRLVFLLPGNPLACLCAYDLFAGRAIRGLGWRPTELPYRSVLRPLREELRSALGRVDYFRVRLDSGRVVVVPGGPSGLRSAVAADGFVLVETSRELIPAGEMVEVFLY